MLFETSTKACVRRAGLFFCLKCFFLALSFSLSLSLFLSSFHLFSSHQFAKDPTANKFLSPPEMWEKKRKSVFIEWVSANTQLSQLLSDRSLVMLSANSATGKTTTMGRFLSKPFVVPSTGKILIPAVCHLELRGVSSPEKAVAAFRKALAVEGE